MGRWSAVVGDGRQLGTLRRVVWDMMNPETGCPYMTIYTPSEEEPKVMEEFDITVFEDAMNNQHVFATEEDNDNEDGEEEAEGKESNGDEASRVSES